MERVEDLDLDVNMAFYRTYDAAIGRWWQVDPEAEEFYGWSPYHSTLNNPIRYVDPEGDCPWCVGAVLGGLAEYGGQVISNLANGKGAESFIDIDVGDIALATIEGGLTSGGSIIRRTAAKVVLEGARNKFDVGTDLSVKSNDTKTAIVNTGVGLLTGVVSDNAPLKNNIVKVKTPKEAVKAARKEAPVNRKQRIAIQEKAKIRQGNAKAINEAIGGTPIGGTGEFLKGKLQDVSGKPQQEIDWSRNILDQIK